MNPDQAADFSAVRRFAFSACWTTRLMPADTARSIGNASFSMLHPHYRNAPLRGCTTNRTSHRNGNEGSHRSISGLFARREPGGDADAIGLGAVLAHLPLALELGDGNADAHDPAQLSGDEIGRRVANGPRRRARLLMPPGQARHH